MDTNLRAKRVPKPRAVYSPEVTVSKHFKKPAIELSDRNAETLKNQDKRSKNVVREGVYNKWAAYTKTILKLASSIARETHYIDVHQSEKSDSNYRNKYDSITQKEILKSENKIRAAKETILETFQLVENEVKDDKIWPELAQEDEEGNVDLEHVLCSKCNLEDQEGNDILICDRNSCYRAYHQLCLDPPIVINASPEDTTTAIDTDNHVVALNDDWFCWHCECIDDSLDAIGELLGTEYDDWHDLFPELRIAPLTNSGENDQNLMLIGGDDNSESDDDDYIPHNTRLKKEKKQNKTSTGSAEGDSSGEDYFNESSNSGRDDGGNKSDNDSDGSGDDDGDDNSGSDNDSGGDDEDGDMDNDSADGIDGTKNDGNNDNDDDNDSDIDQDEIAGLLQDADMSAQDLVGFELQPRQLRKRKDPNASDSVAEVPINGTESDVGKRVARVHRGVVVVGEIVEVVVNSSNDSSSSAVGIPSSDAGACEEAVLVPPSDASAVTTPTAAEELLPPRANDSRCVWKVQYTDGVTVDIDDQTKLREAMREYADYIAAVKKADAADNASSSSSKAATDSALGVIDEANIITTKRARKTIDYVSLSLAMFGDLADEDEENDESVTTPHDVRGSAAAESGATTPAAVTTATTSSSVQSRY